MKGGVTGKIRRNRLHHESKVTIWHPFSCNPGNDEKGCFTSTLIHQ